VFFAKVERAGWVSPRAMGQSYSGSSARWSQLEDMVETDTRRGPLGTGSFGVVWRAR